MTSNDKVQELSSTNFEDFTKDKVVLIDFFADWCMPCLMMSPVIDDLSDKFKGKIKFGKVDVDDNQELAQKFNVSSIHNFILFKKGEVAEQFTGSMTMEEFEEKVRKHL